MQAAFCNAFGRHCAESTRIAVITRRSLHRSSVNSIIYKKIDSLEEYDGFEKRQKDFKVIKASNYVQKHARPIFNPEEPYQYSLVHNPSTYFKMTMITFMCVIIILYAQREYKNHIRYYRLKGHILENQAKESSSAN